MPRGLDTEFAIGKVDHQINQSNRLSFRYMFFDNFITANVAGVTANIPNSVQQATDFADRQHSTGAQLISTIGAKCSTNCACSTPPALRAGRPSGACRNRASDSHLRRRKFRRSHGGDL